MKVIKTTMKEKDESDTSLLAEEDIGPMYETEQQPDIGLYPTISWQLSFIWHNFLLFVHQFAVDAGLIHLAERIARKAVQHPFITLALATTILSIGLPLLVVALFTLSTVFITFTGFVMLEGTLISISSVLLFGCLGAMLIVCLFFAGVTTAGYFGFLHIYDLYRGIHNKSAITNYLRRERRTVS